MDKCKFAFLNVVFTSLTALSEYKTAPSEEEGIRRVSKIIRKNKTIDSIVDCALPDKQNCQCQ